MNPKLRPLDFQPIMHQGQRMWLLADPMRLSDKQLIVPQDLAPLLVFCDGTRTPDEIHAAFCEYVGGHVDRAVVTSALAQFDEALLLDNGRFQQAQQALLNDYRAQPHRPPALADLSYPGNADELTRQFHAYGAGDNLNGWQPWRGRGIISPHIDYHRGGAVYAQVWRRAETAVREADLVLIFGTDHNGGLGTVTLTRQAYATPYGVLPTDLTLIDHLAEAIGPDAAFAEELHHKQEHSVELSAVWLHHIYQQAGITPKPMVPILCGSFHHFVMDGAHPADDERLTAVINTLQRETQGKNILAVASVDLAHVGPAFGDNHTMTQSRRTALRQSDHALIQAILHGDAADFYQQIASIEDRNRICGFSSIYLLLRYLNATHGQQIAYQHCPADQQDHSLVSICGLLLE
ncbi:MAG: AmmeMemoRadiSam system protein B [Ardenticatenaceae bacterium]|nr:AmmeMemoRadiSam system protein B [Ardenticatenaceae bacterium]